MIVINLIAVIFTITTVLADCNFDFSNIQFFSLSNSDPSKSKYGNLSDINKTISTDKILKIQGLNDKFITAFVPALDSATTNNYLKCDIMNVYLNHEYSRIGISSLKTLKDATTASSE